MINILVRLEVKDFSAFEQFEARAVQIMGQYQGKIISSFETVRNADGSGQEIHVLQFPDKDSFDAYRQDSSLNELKELRLESISSTEIDISIALKSY